MSPKDLNNDLGDSRIYTNFERLLALKPMARSLSFDPHFRPAGMLSGRHRSRLRGPGLNFEELRHYQTGDNIRAIDPRASARLGQPYVKVYSQETDRPVHIIVDQRQSLFFGSRQYTKSLLAAELAALIGWASLNGGDRVGGAVLSNDNFVSVAPRRSQSSFLQLLKLVCDCNRALTPADELQLGGLLESISPLCAGLTSLASVILITDINGIATSELTQLRSLSERINLLLFVVEDLLERDISSAQGMTVSSLGQSSDEQLCISGAMAVDEFARRHQQQQQALQQALMASNFPVGHINTQQPVEQQLRQLLERGA